MAQATITGSINARYENSNVLGTAAGKVNGFRFSDSEVRFNFAEDLGNGLKATGSFGFENGTDQTAAVGSGTTLGVSGGFGSLTVSTQESSDYLAVDQVTTSGFSNGSVTDRVTFSSPTIMGARLSVIYGDSLVGLGSNSDASSMVYSLDYAAGPLSVNVGSLSTQAPNTLTAGTRAKVTYNAGVATVSYGMVNTTTGTDDRKENAFTVSVPLGAITASYAVASSKTGTAAKLSGSNLTLAYALSKRTTLSFNKIDYDASASITNAQINRVNLSHSF